MREYRLLIFSGDGHAVVGPVMTIRAGDDDGIALAETLCG
jgi:hypothetical protein